MSERCVKELKPHESFRLTLSSELFLLQLQSGRNLIEHCRNERWKTLRSRIQYHIRKKEPKS
jgi:hypothetical protein